MVFESMGSSSQTVQPISKTIADDYSTHGLTANTSSRREASGSSQTLTAGVLTAGTLGRFLLHLFNIDFVPYGRFIQKSLTHRAFLPALAALRSAIAWSGHV